MLRDSLVSINITENNQDNIILRNPNNVPILFYWNGEDDLKETLLNDPSLRQYIYENLLELDHFGKISLNYFYFICKDDNENYQEDSIMLQDLYKLDNIYNTEKIVDFIYNIFIILYYQFLKKDYVANSKFSKNENIQRMYIDIQNAYPKRFIKESVINYVRNELLTKYKINNENTDVIIDVLSQILLHNE